MIYTAERIKIACRSLQAAKNNVLGGVYIMIVVFKAFMLAVAFYATLILIASAIPKSKHEKWHYEDGK